MFTFRIVTDESFNFRSVVESHGWYQLAPFQYLPEHRILSRVHRLSDGRVVLIHVEPGGNTSRPSFLLVQVEGEVYSTDLAELDAVVRRILCMDWGISGFYDLLRSLAGYEWVESAGAGRILRSPTVWEDLVKVLLTTNTTWQQTIGMCRRLVTLGDNSAFGHTFPTPQQVIALDVAALTAHVQCGYRGAFLHALAEQIAAGALDVEAWLDPELDSVELYKQIKGLKGFGDYAAATIMRLLGHHDRISIDSVCREMFVTRYNGGERVQDAAITAHYEQYGRWRGLVMWMDVIRDDYTE